MLLYRRKGVVVNFKFHYFKRLSPESPAHNAHLSLDTISAGMIK